jgi:hypothetical protein
VILLLDQFLKRHQSLIMPAQLTIAELTTLTPLLRRNRPGQTALAALNQYDRQLDVSFDQLCAQKIGVPLVFESSDARSFWSVTIAGLKPILCADPTFATKVETYQQKPDNAALLTDLVNYLVGRSGMPIDPAMGVLLTLFLLRQGLPDFCQAAE